MKPPVDDHLDDLPPIDGDGEDGEGQKEEVDLTIPGGSSGLLDEATVDDLDVGDPIGDGPGELEPGDDLWDGETGDNLPAGDERPPLRPEDDDPGIGDSEIELDEDAGGVAGDGGDDGPLCEDDLPLGGDLPAMDADDEGDFEESLVREMGLADERPPIRTGLELSERDAFALALPCDPLAHDAVLVSVPDFDGVVRASARDGVVLTDRRAKTTTHNLWRELPGAERFFPGAGPLCAALGPGRVLWLATPGGHLLRGEGSGEVWEDRGRLPRSVRALDVRVDGTLSAVCTDQPELCVITSADGRSWFERPLAVSSAPYKKGRSWLSQSGLAVAVGHENAFVLISRDGGLTLQEIAVGGALAGVFAGEGTWAPLLVASLDDGSGLVRLVRVDADGSVDVVGDVAAVDEDDPGPDRGALFALAWDAAREWIWVFSGAKLAAWGRRQLQ
jgi:hypothetical protein